MASTGDEEGAAAVVGSSEHELLPLGEVVAILQRSMHSVVGCLRPQDEEEVQQRAGGLASTRQVCAYVCARAFDEHVGRRVGGWVGMHVYVQLWVWVWVYVYDDCVCV